MAALEQSRDAASKAVNEASVTISFENSNNSSSTINDKTVKHLSAAVTNIVEATFDDDEFARTCLTIMKDVAQGIRAIGDSNSQSIINNSENSTLRLKSIEGAIARGDSDLLLELSKLYEGTDAANAKASQSIFSTLDTFESLCKEHISNRAIERYNLKKLEYLSTLNGTKIPDGYLDEENTFQ